MKGKLIFGLSATLIAACTLLVVLRPGAPAEIAPYDRWYILRINGSVGGYSQEKRSTAEGMVRTETLSEMRIGRMGQETRMLEEYAWEEKPDGTPVRFRYRSKLSDRDTIHIGTVKDGKLEIVVTSGGVEEKKTYTWFAHFLFPARAERLQREKGWAAGTTYTYMAWNPQFSKAVTHTVKVGAKEKVGDRELVRTVTSMDAMPNIDTVQWLDDQGRVVKSRTEIISQVIEQELTDRATALKSQSGDAPEVLAKTLLKPERMPKDPRKVRRAVYRITITEGEVKPDGLRWDGQTVDKVEGSAITVTIDPPRPPEPVPTLPVDRADMEPFLKETTVLQCHHAQVVAAAKEAVGGEKDAWKAAKLIEAYVRRRVSKKNFGVGFATAAEVAERLEGDCTEHSVFSAAIARAVGLPSRVAVGLVAVGDIYGGHMWTEVWVGRWVPLDATLGGDPFDATHIKMGESAGSGAGLQEDFLNVLLYLGRMKLEIVEITE